MSGSIFTVRLHGDIAKVIDKIIEKGYSQSKAEAIRTALFLYASKLGLLSNRKMHDDILAEMKKSGKRYSIDDVKRQIEELES